MVAEAGSLEVHFLHKSVIDFLEQPQVWETLDGFVEGLDFNAGRALAVASLRELKATLPELGMVLVEDNEPSHVWYTLKRALQECALVEESTGEAQEMVLDMLDEVMDYHWRCIGGWRPHNAKSLDEMAHWSYQFDCGIGHCDSMFTMACLFGLQRYVSQAVEDDPRKAQLALEHIVVNAAIDERGFSLDIIELCLKHGADVNRQFHKGLSPWQVVLSRCNPRTVVLSENFAMVVHRMLDAGADMASGLEEVIFSPEHSGNFRIQRSPLEVLRERFLDAAGGQSRPSSARKINMILKKLTRHVIEKGGLYHHTVEKQVACLDGVMIVWDIADPVVAREV